jgi:hypothetical protein
MADVFGGDVLSIGSLETICAMDMAAETFGATNRYGSISLADSAHAAGLDFIGDALTTAALYEMMKIRQANR